MNGKRSTPQASAVRAKVWTSLGQAIIKTLAFFALYSLPVSSQRLTELLSGQKATPEEVEQELSRLVSEGSVVSRDGLYALKDWDSAAYRSNQQAIAVKLAKVRKHRFWLSVIPFARHISIINSLAIGNADKESDIDFFVITQPRRLYVVRSIVIILFRALGLYKTRKDIADRFCFGFYVTADKLDLSTILIKPNDPYILFWLACMQPLLYAEGYQRLIAQNPWLSEFFPNFPTQSRIEQMQKSPLPAVIIKKLLEVLLFVPAVLLEPIARRVHINHTFKLKENLSMTSTTIANESMLKLHASDVRKVLAEEYTKILNLYL